MDSNESDDRAVLARTATAIGTQPVPAGNSRHLSRGDSLGRYTILEQLGEGGMGVVYGAYDPDLDRKVALKLLRAREGDGMASDAARARLLREARAIAKISHPNVITVYEVGTAGHTDFVAMEFVDGESLAEWLEREHEWHEVLRVFSLAGRGLAAAHRAGLVHRDFKPANVLLGTDGRVRVTDFGLARLAGDSTPSQAPADVESEIDGEPSLAATLSRGLTRSGALLGTPAYMAPEQHEGGVADERSDQFSFCVALYEGLYGARPFGGDTFEELREATMAGQLPDEPRGSLVPAWVRRVVLRGLASDPAQRYADMTELLTALGHDPVTLRRRFIAFGSSGMLALLAIAFFSTRSCNARSAGDVCAAGAQDLDRVWSPKARARLSDALSRAGSAGARAADRVVPIVDGYTRQWKKVYSDTCSATRVRRERSEADLHLHMGCLLERRNQLASLIEVFSRPDPEVVEQAVQAAQSLPDVQACADLEALRRGVPPPADRNVRRQVDAVRADLTAVKALQQAARYPQARKRAATALAAARATGYQPVLAEALYRSGRIEYFIDRPTTARKRFERAALIADLAGYDELRARALVGLVQVGALFSSRTRETRRRALLADAVIRRHGSSSLLRARLHSALGMLHLEEDDYDRALRRFQSAYTLYRQTHGADFVAAARPLLAMANIHELLGHPDEALALARRALAMLEGQLGTDHPRVVSARESVALRLRLVYRFREAKELMGKVARFWQSPRGRELLAASYPIPGERSKRAVRGRVLGPDGTPVANAEVLAGAGLFSDGYYLDPHASGRQERELGWVRGRTDARGRFELSCRSAPLAIAAEHDRGRSHPKLVPASGDVEVELRLAPFGRLAGKVTYEGKRPPNMVVSGTPKRLSKAPVRSLFGVTVKPDGSFEVERLAAGTYEVYLSVGVANRSFSGREVTIEANQTTTIELDARSAGATVDVEVSGAGGQPIDTAQVVLFDEPVSVKTVGELSKVFARASQAGRARMAYLRPVAAPAGADDLFEEAARRLHVEFRGVPPGKRSVCIIPIVGEIKDPQFARRLTAHIASLAVHCRRLDVRDGRALQKVKYEVPSMRPLPPPTTGPGR